MVTSKISKVFVYRYDGTLVEAFINGNVDEVTYEGNVTIITFTNGDRVAYSGFSVTVYYKSENAGSKLYEKLYHTADES